MPHPDPNLIALGIRQPWAELILRGIKTIEVRTLPTSIRGPIYLYSSKTIADTEPARDAAAAARLNVEELPRGVLVGTVEITDCRWCLPEDAASACLPAELLTEKLGWRLNNPQQLETPLKVRFLPYGVWFYPFRRKSETHGRPRR